MARNIRVFQSTLPHGSDFLHSVARDDSMDISIHAPSRERPERLVFENFQVAFQSTLPHGSDFKRILTSYLPELFQSTLPHGSD